MPKPKLKSENYQNLGGINSKVSPYTLGPQEFLDLTNVDFQTPGSLTQAWGSTNYIGGSLPLTKVTGVFGFEKTTGFSSIVVGTTGSIWQHSGATILGISTGIVGATFAVPVEFSSVSWDAGSGWLDPSSSSIFWNRDRSQIITKTSHVSGTLVIPAIVFNENNLDATVFQNSLYLADGSNFCRFDGATLFRIGMPYAFQYPNTFFVNGSTSYPFKRSKFYSFATSFSNTLGEEGPLLPIMTVDPGGASYTTFRVGTDIICPPGYDIAKINWYVYEGATAVSWGAGAQSAWSVPYYFFKSETVAAGATVTTVTMGSSSDTFAVGETAAKYALQSESYGFTLSGFSNPAGSRRKFEYGLDAPKIIEQFQNRAFISGFTSAASAFRFSEVGQPSVYGLESEIEARTNDGDIISGVKAYGQRLLIGKGRSFHQLTGDNEDNFVLTEVSSEYGVCNNRCITTYGDLAAFYDPNKGVVGYNGAALDLLSFRIQPLIERINKTAAVTHACMAHDKTRNQLLLAVPMDGATINNTTLVYDYIANAWTKYAGFNPAIFAIARGSFSSDTVFYGGYTGTVSYFGASFLTYAGSEFTCSWKTRFLSELGNSTEKVWRKLWLDIDDPLGVTMPLAINFYKNHSSAIGLTRMMYSSPNQSLIDFGLSAKSISIEVHKSSPTTIIKFHGYTVAFRHQRDE